MTGYKRIKIGPGCHKDIFHYVCCQVGPHHNSKYYSV